jgi:polyisoprenoid-binding protein YceI
VAVLLAVGGAAFAYLFWFAGGSGEPSTELTTPELSATTSTGGPDPTSTTAASVPTSTLAGGETSQPEEVASTRAFVIDQNGTVARFEIDEVLNGDPAHVIGTTDQVVGQIRIDTADLADVEVSDIIINARTLETGSERRNRAIRGPVILDSGSDQNELISFQVTSVDGLSGSASVGDTFEFAITGDLTVKSRTQPVTFDATVTWLEEGALQGSATAEITRDMFDIGIPSVPGVADVTNEVLIGLEFLALSG